MLGANAFFMGNRSLGLWSQTPVDVFLVSHKCIGLLLICAATLSVAGELFGDLVQQIH